MPWKYFGDLLTYSNWCDIVNKILIIDQVLFPHSIECWKEVKFYRDPGVPDLQWFWLSKDKFGCFEKQYVCFDK